MRRAQERPARAVIDPSIRSLGLVCSGSPSLQPDQSAISFLRRVGINIRFRKSFPAAATTAGNRGIAGRPKRRLSPIVCAQVGGFSVSGFGQCPEPAGGLILPKSRFFRQSGSRRSADMVSEECKLQHQALVVALYWI